MSNIYVLAAEASTRHSLAQVIYAVSVRKERPALPASCPQPLADIIERCWAQDDKARPTAAQLVRQLDALMGATVNTQPDS